VEPYVRADRLAYWVLITCNLAIPLTTLWSRKLRTNIAFMFIISIVVNTGMWFERFVIVVTSLYRDFLPSSWGLIARRSGIT